MLLDVVFSPTEIPVALAARPGVACAVIDVVRATTTLTVMGEQRAARVLVAGDVALARAIAAGHPQALLAGEVKGLAPAGFNYSNAPSVLGQQDLSGRELIFATTNGTRAMQLAQQHGASAIYAAALRNASAIVTLALQYDVFALLCAGLYGRTALDDLYTAGVITEMIAIRAAATAQALELTEGAAMAREFAQHAGEPLAVLRRSQGGQNTLTIEMAADLTWCAAIDASVVLPRMSGMTEDGALIFTFA